ncbi:MAG: hypothetical protein JNL32_05290 [Candidatus Kapabacteria bacterium]|nr:hypothetical protein [Candidatus Kapabacteria bacterium]
MRTFIPLTVATIIIALGLSAFTSPVLPPLLRSLNGKWKGGVAGFSTSTVIYEQWSVQSDTRMTGKGWSVRNGTATDAESIELTADENGIWYIPTLKNQNNGKPVRFLLKEQTANSFTFSNPSHDFPQTISYTFPTKDSMIAVIGGTQKNMKYRSIEFRFSREQ